MFTREENTPTGQPPLPVDTYSFFGMNFGVAFDSAPSREIYRSTYKHFGPGLQAEDLNGCTMFHILSENAPDTAPRVIVEHSGMGHLIEMFRRGSYQYRYKVTPSQASSYEVRDSFLSNRLVMRVGKNTCTILDIERWNAYAESIVFNTIVDQIPHHHLMHAGVVAQNDKAVILCGDTNRGKTTLTLGLVRHGFKFLSDEVAFIETAYANVQPFPRALGLRRKTIDMFTELNGCEDVRPIQSLGGDDKWLVDVEQLFPGSLGRACRVSAIVFLEGFSESTELTPIPRSEALFKCIRLSHTPGDNPMQDMLNIAGVFEHAETYRLKSGPVTEAVSIISDMVNSR